MADNSPILIGRDNSANPGAQTFLNRDANSTSTDPVFTVRTPVGGDGIHGEASGDRTGVQGTSPSGTGVLGTSSSSFGVGGFGSTRIGVVGASDSSIGVRGSSSTGIAVYGFSSSGFGVLGRAAPKSGKAGWFDGGITVVNGLKPFTIDHPLDPENKYLVHTSVESSEMKNVYDGVARLDEEGAAWVELPEWFEALNGDFRYQLTAVGGSAPGLHVAEEVSENRFKMAGGEEGMKVCWQLTGTRKDP